MASRQSRYYSLVASLNPSIKRPKSRSPERAPMTQSDADGPLDARKPPSYFGEALNDAERLLKYAAEIGTDVDADTRSAILQARTAYTYGGWNDQIAADLLTALTHLAARLKPVTAESLKAYNVETRPIVKTYFIWSLILAAIILPVS